MPDDMAAANSPGQTESSSVAPELQTAVARSFAKRRFQPSMGTIQ